MGVLTTVAAGVGLVIAGIVIYAIACVAVLSLVRLPDEGVYVLLEDLLFVATLPFVGVVVILPAIRR